MTEQQFEKLKTLLNSSRAPENSTELDNKILGAAKYNIEQSARRHEEAPESISHMSLIASWFARFFQRGLIQSAVLSVTLTLTLFFVLGQILKTDQESSYVKNPLQSNENNTGVLADIQLTKQEKNVSENKGCLLYTSPSPRDRG